MDFTRHLPRRALSWCHACRVRAPQDLAKDIGAVRGHGAISCLPGKRHTLLGRMLHPDGPARLKWDLLIAVCVIGPGPPGAVKRP